MSEPNLTSTSIKFRISLNYKTWQYEPKIDPLATSNFPSPLYSAADCLSLPTIEINDLNWTPIFEKIPLRL